MATAISVLDSKAERGNFQRVTYLLIEHGTSVLRETFDSIISPAQLTTDLYDPLVQAKLGGARLTRPDWDTLYPPSGAPVKSSDFDITLLFRLLRTICNLKEPPTGWNDMPDPADTSLEADLVRIKFYRNSVYGHVRDMKITDVEFQTLWKEISFAILGLARKLSSKKELEYKEIIDKLLIAPMVPKEDQELQLLVEHTLTKKLSDLSKEQRTRVEETLNKAVSQVTTHNKEYLEETIDKKLSETAQQIQLFEETMRNTLETITEKLIELQAGKENSAKTKAEHQQSAATVKVTTSSSSEWTSTVTNEASQQKASTKVNTATNREWNALLSAAKGGNVDIIRQFICAGYNIESRNEQGWTPLMIAAGTGNADAANYFISEGADRYAVDDRGWNALHVASQVGDVTIIKNMLSAGIDINSRTNRTSHQYVTPLMMAAGAGEAAAASYLISMGADHSAVDHKGWNVLHKAALGGHVTTIENILSVGIDINSRTSEGFTPLMIAAGTGKAAAAIHLIRVGADHSAVDHIYGMNVLHYAAQGGDVTIIEKMLSVSIAIKSRTNNGETPLMVAASYGNGDAITYLISRGGG